MKKNESISIPAEIVARIKESNPNESNRSVVIQTLERYADIVKVGLREVRKTFTDAELNLLCDICNGTSFEPFGVILENNGILLQYDDTVDIYGKMYFEKWGVGEFAYKLEALSKLGQIALMDLIEKFWNTKPAAVGDLFRSGKK